MKVKRLNETNWLDKEGYSKRIYFGEDLLSKGSLVQEIKIKSGETAKSHYHQKQTEVFYFLNNNGYFVVNGEKIEVNIGDVLVVEPMDKHVVVNNTNEDFLYLCFKINYQDNDLIWD